MREIEKIDVKVDKEIVITTDDDTFCLSLSYKILFKGAYLNKIDLPCHILC